MSTICEVHCNSCQTVFKVRLDGKKKKSVWCPKCKSRNMAGGTQPASKPTPKSTPPVTAVTNPPATAITKSAPSQSSNRGDFSQSAPSRSVTSPAVTPKKSLKYPIIGGMTGLVLISSVVLGFMFIGGDDQPGNNNKRLASDTTKTEPSKTEPSNKETTIKKTKSPEEKEKKSTDSSWVKSGTAPRDMFSLSDMPNPEPPTIFYKWPQGKSYWYSVSFDADFLGKKELYSGLTILKIGSERSTYSFKSEGHQQQGLRGTGTGFVVDPNGYIVTYKHVIDGASQIKARVNGTVYTAKLLAVHENEDLAILQVQGTHLPTLPIADSKLVDIAQTVRAIGYPITRILGNDDVKYTSGTIAGKIYLKGDNKSKRFHLDCVVNPGNSGGPLFNDKGEVIGVTDSKIVKKAVSQVSFAIPTELVEGLLKKHNVSYQKTASQKKILPVDLVKKVKSAIVYLEVTMESKKKGRSFEIAYNTEIRLDKKQNGTQGKSNSSATKIMSEQGKMLVSEFGSVHDYQGKKALPYFFGRIGTMMIEDLPNHKMNEWNSKKAILVEGTPCIISSSYKTVQDNNDRIIVEKKYDLRSMDNIADPTHKINGTGSVVFNKLKGVPESYLFRGEMAWKRKGGAARFNIPIVVKYQLLSEEQVNKIRNRK